MLYLAYCLIALKTLTSNFSVNTVIPIALVLLNSKALHFFNDMPLNIGHLDLSLLDVFLIYVIGHTISCSFIFETLFRIVAWVFNIPLRIIFTNQKHFELIYYTQSALIGISIVTGNYIFVIAILVFQFMNPFKERIEFKMQFMGLIISLDKIMVDVWRLSQLHILPWSESFFSFRDRYLGIVELLILIKMC